MGIKLKINSFQYNCKPNHRWCCAKKGIFNENYADIFMPANLVLLLVFEFMHLSGENEQNCHVYNITQQNKRIKM